MASSPKSSRHPLTSENRPVSNDAVLKVTKEIVVKFIEIGRLSPSGFDETFQNIYRTVHATVRAHEDSENTPA